MKLYIPFESPIVVVTDEASVEHILKANFNNYIKGPYMQAKLFDLFGHGIFNTNGKNWKHQRQQASHMFKVRDMKADMTDVIVEHSNMVVDKIKQFASKNQEFDISDIFYRFTLDSIGQIAFGRNLKTLEKDIPFSEAFNYTQQMLTRRYINPFWKITPTPKLTEAIKIMDDTAYEIIKSRRQDIEGTRHGKDLLSRYLSLVTDENEPLSDQYLRDIIINFMVAGRDTTAASLSWVITLLCQHPEVESKVREEINLAFPNGEEPDYDSVKNLTYLNAVVEETLRLYPQVPVDPKTAVEDDTLPNGVHVKKGTRVAWSGIIMGRSKHLWEDSLKFKPERWLGEEGKKIGYWKHIPFQAGPRICLGMGLAYLEIKILTIMILQNFKLNLVPGKSLDYAFAITMPPEQGVWVKASQ